jgi:predicted dehydrogenase
MKQNQGIQRRAFLKQVSALAAGFHILPASVFGRGGAVTPGEKITLGFIGVGKEGRSLLREFLDEPDARILAVCDVDKLKLERARNLVKEKYAEKAGSNVDCDVFHDYRELLARDDIDAVVISTPDHWHAIQVVESARAGKDIYCEKPLSLTIREARQMVNAVRRFDRVLQTGSMQRSDNDFRMACELVRNGCIGDLKRIYAAVGDPSSYCNLPGLPVPDYLDWDRWLGPAPWRPYHPILSPHVSEDIFPNWRLYRDYSGGAMTDWGAHHFDIAQWALGMDQSGPVEIIPPNGNDVRDLTYIYANGVPLIRSQKGNGGIVFEGTRGTVHVTRSILETTPESLVRHTFGPNDIRLVRSRNHYADWLEAIRKRSRPICDVEVGCRSVTVCHLGNIANLLGRPLKWDPAKEEFINDDQANQMRDRAKRTPWHV